MTYVSESSLMKKACVHSPIGQLTVVASEVGIRRIFFATLTDDQKNFLSDVEHDSRHHILEKALTQLTEYFDGVRLSFDVALDLVGTDFQRQAWLSLAAVDYGCTATYAQQAASLGRPKAVRAVGSANKMNPVPIVLPCHRIIGSNGSLTGFAGGLDTKKWLLDHERSVLDCQSHKETACN
ncbi:MAG: methylated-DNA--protein-cysteine methyltransferase [Actinomycetota bacterium]